MKTKYIKTERCWGVYFRFEGHWFPFVKAKQNIDKKWTVFFEPSFIAKKFGLAVEIRRKAMDCDFFYKEVENEQEALEELNTLMKSDIIKELRQLCKQKTL